MLWLALLLAAASCSVHAQLNAQSSVAPDLRECYTAPYLVDRNNLPPTTLQVLIDIIQKIEDDPNVNVDLRQLVLLLLHTYKQDGIEFHQPESNLVLSSNVLPFAPTFHSFHRHRLLLSRILPNNLLTLGNNTLNPILKCALHHMVSTTVDARVRGNENNCNRLSQYRALRTVRDIPSYLKIRDDVEILNLDSVRSANTNGKMRHYNPKDDVVFNTNSAAALKYERQVLGDSQCPLLDGAVYTKWGAISAGHVLSGIAAGAQFQRIPITELAKGSLVNFPNVQTTVSSIFASTLSGDLAEAVLIQGTETGSSTISVGLAGNWNTTQAPRFYMLNNRVNVEMTDPEISGDIDGFVLGTLLNTELSGSGTIRLSQLLDMYYSERNGVFNPDRRACNRRQLSQDFIDRSTLVEETYAFTAALDTNMPLRGTIVGGISELVNSAVTNFQSYTTNNLNNLICETTEVTASFFRMKTNLMLVVDSTWQYQTIYPAISYLLDSIEVGKYGSSITLLNAFNGDVVVNKTFSLADFHSNYTQAVHQNIVNGVNLENTLLNIRTTMLSELENEKTANYVGGNSTVLLFLLNAGNIQNNQQILEQVRMLNETVPDLRIFFATSSNQFDNLWNLVRDMHNDIRVISLNSDGTNVASIMNPVLQRIQSVGRRIVNSNCGSVYDSQSESGIRQFDDYLEPGYTNYYSISPNYFFRNHDNRKVRISRTGAGVGSLIICQSRTDPMPRQNTTTSSADENAIICQTLATGSVEISLRGACDNYWRIVECPFFFISVQSSVAATTTLSSTCTERACRFPYNIRYQVQIEDFGCFSHAGRFNLSFSLIISAILFYLLKL
ncbi:uncharacterized protein LOC126966309 [Leptidea sinapis]|nr:uncharacterized protein LOC126966309 [Leptidea sinapis]